LGTAEKVLNWSSLRYPISPSLIWDQAAITFVLKITKIKLELI